MKDLNPIAFTLWVFGGSLGYAIADWHGCAIGISICTFLTFVGSIVRGEM